MSSNTSANAVGLTLQATGGNGQAKVLNSAEATQFLQKLRAVGAAGSGQAIKIQAIQTNPNTGVRQIVAIPISSAASGGAMMAGGNKVSPMKVIRLPAGASTTAGGGGGTTQIVTMSPAQFTTAAASGGEFAQNVKVVKIPAGSSISNSLRPPPLQSQVLTPSKGHVGGALVEAAGGRGDSYNDGGGGGGVVNNKRRRSDIDFDSFSEAKRRKTDKGGKGLRHFSMKVCEKVQAKGSTSYNEVADELVNELTDPGCSSPQDQQYDQKNIRRRVYDALNVLMAMNIINKEKKEIRWLGLPTNSVQEANGLEVDKTKRIERIKAKTQQLQDLILQQIAFKNLVERNKDREKTDGAPAPNSAIQLPFIIVNTSKDTVIDCSISNDKREYLFNFDDTFEIHDDMEVLKRMGLGFGLERGDVRPENLEKARKMVPRALEQYVLQLAENGPGGSLDSIPKVSSPKILRELSTEREQVVHSDSDSDVDIN